MKFIPHDYQQYAIDFIKNNEVAAVLYYGIVSNQRLCTAIADATNKLYYCTTITITHCLYV